MAISELFRQIGQKYLVEASQTKNQAASNSYQKAASLSLRGDIQEAQVIATSAQQLLSESARLLELDRKLMEVLVPGIIRQLQEEFGIAEPSPDFTKHTVPAVDVEVKLQAGVTIGQKESKKRESKRIHLTDKQYKSARVQFRLLDMEKEEASLEDGVKEQYSQEISEGTRVAIIKGRIGGQMKWVIKNLDNALEKLKKDDQPIRFPLTEEQLALLIDYPEIQDIATRLGGVEFYQGMTLSEIVEYTKTWRPIRLKKEAEIVSSVSPREEPTTYYEIITEEEEDQKTPQEKEKSLYTFSDAELFYLTRQLVKKGTVPIREDDRQFLEGKLDEMMFNETEVEDSNLASQIQAKLSKYRGNEEVFFDAQNELGQLVLATIIGKSPDELSNLLIQ